MQRRKRHYERISKMDRREYGNCVNVHQVAERKGVIVGQSLRNLGFNVSYRPAAQSAVYRITGKMPIISYTTKAVAGYRRMKGDAVGVQTTRRGDSMQGFIDHRVTVARPQQRPFYGYARDQVDQNGNCTLSISNPMGFPEREKQYESFLPLCSKTGLYVTLETTARTRDEGVALLTSRQLPIKG